MYTYYLGSYISVSDRSADTYNLTYTILLLHRIEDQNISYLQMNQFQGVH